jgi:hypothetical protein
LCNLEFITSKLNNFFENVKFRPGEVIYNVQSATDVVCGASLFNKCSLTVYVLQFRGQD